MNYGYNIKNNPSKIVYLGFRPKDSYDLHLRYSNKKIYDKPVLYGTLRYKKHREDYYES